MPNLLNLWVPGEAEDPSLVAVVIGGSGANVRNGRLDLHFNLRSSSFYICH